MAGTGTRHPLPSSSTTTTREKIYKILIYPYGGQEKLKKGGKVLISFFLNGLILEGKCISLLKFFVVV
jgi:hypothetical protein